MWGVEIAVMACMIAVNSVLAAYEIALASVTLARLEILAAEVRSGAVAAAYMKRNMEGSLAGIQLGITLVGAVAAATGGAGAEEQLAPAIQNQIGVSTAQAEILALAAVVVPLTFVTIVFGELIPKVFALRNKEWVCLALSPMMKVFVTTVWPIVWLLEAVVTGLMAWGERRFRDPGAVPESSELQELRASANLARTSRLIGAQEERIILRAAGLTTLMVREIMLPAEAISMLSADGSVGEGLVAAHLDMHTRFPITEKAGDPQAIIGYVNFKDIVAHMRIAPQGDGSLRNLMRSIPSFSEETRVSTCLEQLIRDHIHIALIRNEANRVLGMVTLEDMLEELVGEIEDEFDSLPSNIRVIARGWIVGGGVGLASLREATGIEIPQTTANSGGGNLSDWICAKLGDPLRVGETVTHGNIRVLVRKIRRHRVVEAQIEQPESTPA